MSNAAVAFWIERRTSDLFEIHFEIYIGKKQMPACPISVKRPSSQPLNGPAIAASAANNNNNDDNNRFLRLVRRRT